MPSPPTEYRPVLAYSLYDHSGRAHLQTLGNEVTGRALCGVHVRRGLSPAEYDAAPQCANCFGAVAGFVATIAPRESVFDSWAVGEHAVRSALIRGVR